MEFIDSLIGGGAAGVTVGGITLTVIKTWLNNLVQKNKELENKVSDLENRRINELEKSLKTNLNKLEDTVKTNLDKLEDTVTDHIDDDNNQQVMTELRFINGNIAKLTDQVSVALERSAGQAEAIKANAKYISNLDASFQKHKESSHAK